MKGFTLNLFALPTGRQVARKCQINLSFLLASLTNEELRPKFVRPACRQAGRSEIQMRLLTCILISSLTNKYYL